MEHVGTIILGDKPEERPIFAKALLTLGFPEGVIAVCKECNQVQEFTIDEAAKLVATNTWPRCHDKRMVMEDPENAPMY